MRAKDKQRRKLYRIGDKEDEEEELLLNPRAGS
jgi:hypothetical protein